MKWTTNDGRRARARQTLEVYARIARERGATPEDLAVELLADLRTLLGPAIFEAATAHADAVTEPDLFGGI